MHVSNKHKHTRAVFQTLVHTAQATCTPVHVCRNSIDIYAETVHVRDTKTVHEHVEKDSSHLTRSDIRA